MNIGSKESGKGKSFSCETKAPISCIPMGRTCLWWPIQKLGEIITSIQICLIQRTNFDLKENGGKKSFSYETKAPISCIAKGRTCLWWPILILREIIMSIHVCLFQQTNIGSKEIGKEKSFSCETKAHIHASQWEEYAYGGQSQN